MVVLGSDSQDKVKDFVRFRYATYFIIQIGGSAHFVAAIFYF